MTPADDPLERALGHRVFPVVTIRDAERSVPLGRALAAGGLPVVEVTLRTPAALEAIRRLAGAGDVLVGAGTVLPGSVADAVAAGAAFLVSPGLSPSVVRDARSAGVPILPGVVTPSEVMAALELGLTTLKFFPAGQHGGAATLRALAAPFSGVGFVPTGGIGPGDVADYLAVPSVRAVAGSWLAPVDLVEAGDFAAITARVRAAVAAAAPRG